MGSSIKTGTPPSFKAQTDLSTVIPAMAANVGIDDLGKAIDFYKRNRGAIQALIGFFKGLFGGGKKDSGVTAPVPTPAPTPAPAPAPTPAPRPSDQRTPEGLKAGLMLVEKKRNPRQAGGGRYIVDKGTFDEIKSGSSPARRGDRLHMNVTPFDRYGDFMPGGEENKSLLHDASGGPNSPSRISHIITGGGELTSEYDDHGCTPVVLIPWEKEPGVGFPIDTGKRWEVTYQARGYWADGRVSESNVVRVNVEE